MFWIERRARGIAGDGMTAIAQRFTRDIALWTLASLVLAGCVTYQTAVFLRAEPSADYVATEGYRPRATIDLAPGGSVSVSGGPGSLADTIALVVTFSVDDGHVLALAGPTLRVSCAGRDAIEIGLSTLEESRIVSTKIKSREIPAIDPLKGSQRPPVPSELDDFSTGLYVGRVTVNACTEGPYVVQLPSILVDGQARRPPPVRFVMAKRRGLEIVPLQ